MDRCCSSSSDEKTPLSRGVPATVPTSSMRRRIPSGSQSSCLSDDDLLDPFYPPSKKGTSGFSCGLGGCERLKKAGHLFKKLFLVVALLAAVVLMGVFPEADEDAKGYKFNVTSGSGSHLIPLDDWHSPVQLSLKGPFLHRSLANMTHVFTTVTLASHTNGTSKGSLSRPLQIMRIPTATTPDAISEISVVVKEQFTITDYDPSPHLLVEIHGSPPEVLYPLQSFLEPSEVEFGLSVFLAASVLTVLYFLIVFELVHRTLAALIGATMAVGSLCVVGQRPSLTQVVSWLDVETLCLLFGMMILVGVLCETGFFDYAAVLAYRLAHGKVWPMVTMLCTFTAIISAFLDNVTTILLMTPVTIKLCEVMDLDPKHVLIILVVFSNIGGAATPVGDPPNVIIISNPSVRSLGVSFTTFTAHMVPGVLLCAMGAYIYLRIYYRDVNKLRLAQCSDYLEMAHEIQVWQKAVFSLAEYSRDETHVRHVLRKKVRKLVRQQSKRSHYARSSTLPAPPSIAPDQTPAGGKTASYMLAEADFRENLRALSEKYRIREPALLVKSTIVLASVIVLFFLQSIPTIHLTLGWIAILGAVMLMVLADTRELDAVIARVEWTTLIFFGALFVVMEALVELKLLLYVGHLTQNWIRSVHHDSRLIVSIIIITWVSALASSFVDNIPFTTVMIKIVNGLGESDLGLKLGPLIYALAFGACLGGNGTLIGASANVVCAGVAEQHGYKFSFFEFFRIGFPLMVLTTALSTAWLLLCHVALHWDI